MSTWKTQAEWEPESSMWVGIVDGRWATQAKRLDVLRRHVVEVVALMADEEITVDDVVVDVVGQDEAEVLRQDRARVDAEGEDVQRRTEELARRLGEQGLTMRDIGTLTGISYQRAHQILARRAS
jgi:hypothetical protein